MSTEDHLKTMISLGQYIPNRHCGYCGSSNGSSIYGLNALSLTVDHYQQLMDRGWRRSGKFLYKPDLKNSCCPQYTIRIKESAFKPSKEHRQAINKFNRFILGSQYDSVQKLSMTSKHAGFNLSTSIHCAEYGNIPQTIRENIKHRLTVKLVTPEFTQEKYALYRHYQQYCHKEPLEQITPSGFKRFLCDAPFSLVQGAYCVTADGKHVGLWHQMYYVDGVLVAMAVLDFLPDTISGVYFMSREDYSKHEFGKLSACREILLSHEENKPYYHIGLYVYHCQKMKYKASFKPSELLDPELYEYFSFDKFEPELAKRLYVTFDPAYSNPLRTVSGRQQSAFSANMSGILARSSVEAIFDDFNVTLIIQNRSMLGTHLKALLPDVYKSLHHTLVEMEAVIGVELFEQFAISVN
ncbi:arginine-tRNA-protein transferase [Lipomyces arxii]|uniref:arginine-tRNA-protein transferase n=1 Tax=Lipomyces arxii TaxID=56418 RepID=UPI0034CD12F3